MGVNLSKTPHVIFFVVVMPALSIALAWAFNAIFPSAPFWMETLSPLMAYGLLYAWFDRALWKLPIFRVIGVVTFPDLRGRWKGSQRSSHQVQGVHTEVAACLEVTQSFSGITVCAYYQRSQSGSIVTSFGEANGDVFLFYTYDNEPNSLQEGTMQMHKGTVKLRHLPKERKLIGMYFNSIGNHGEMNLEFEGHDLLCRFAK